jgi:Kdo2-lipid IVA lauroyltransferase/acyltransferase
MRHLLWFLQFLLIVLLSLPLAIIPYKLALKAGGLLGSLLFHLWKSRRQIAIDNLTGAVLRGAVIINSAPEEVIRENFKNLGKAFIEIIKIYYGLGGRILGNVEIRGAENFKLAYEKGKGTIFITGHCGNWELLALCSMNIHVPVSNIARRINNPYLNYAAERARRKSGNSIIYKQGALKKILSLLRNKGVIGILMDQSVISSEGVIADFLGKKAYTMKMPAMIARKTGSPVLPAFIRRTENSHIIEIGPEIELDDSDDTERAVFNDTVKFSGFIEDYIRQNPAEWLWIHRRWKRIKEQSG